MLPSRLFIIIIIIIIIIVNDKGPKPLTCQNKTNSKIHS